MSRNRPIAVLFDLDGTLIDTIGLLLECARHTFAGRNPAPTDEEWIAGIGTPLRKQFAAYTTSDDEIEEHPHLDQYGHRLVEQLGEDEDAVLQD